MTRGRLRRQPGTPPDAGRYLATGSLDGLAVGRRTVKHLSVGRVDGMSSEEGLEPLLRFPDLQALELNRVAAVSLEPLMHLRSRLLWLRMEDGFDLDLGPLTHASTSRLLLLNLDDRCRVPDRLCLPEDLEVFAVAADGTKASPAVVKRLVEGIEWSRLSGLRELHVRVGGLTALPPIEVDLTFLTHLRRLELLDLHGVWHRGGRPSPLEPPFPGLTKTLTSLHVDAWEPKPLEQALHEYLPLRTSEGNPVGSVSQRYPHQPRAPWQIDEHNGQWHVYGSLMQMPEIADAPDPDSVAATESEALRLAQAKLRATDHGLLRRLDFDDESSGTGISASTREDIQRALTVLRLTAR